MDAAVFPRTIAFSMLAPTAIGALNVLGTAAVAAACMLGFRELFGAPMPKG